MKKKDVQPFISSTTKEVIYKLSFISGSSVKKICDDLCSRALRRKELINGLQPYFKREIIIGGVLYQPNPTPLDQYRPDEKLERITVKVSAQAYEFAYNLAHALNWSLAKVISFCIEHSMSDYDFLEFYTTNILNNKMDDKRKEALLTMMNDSNRDNDLKVELSVASILLAIIDDFKWADESLSDSVGRIAENW